MLVATLYTRENRSFKLDWFDCTNYTNVNSIEK